MGKGNESELAGAAVDCGTFWSLLSRDVPGGGTVETELEEASLDCPGHRTRGSSLGRGMSGGTVWSRRGGTLPSAGNC